MIRVACLLYPGFHLLDVAGPLSVFEVAAHHGYAGYAVETVAAAPGLVRGMGGLALQAASAARSVRFDMLFVPGGLGAREAANYRALLPLVRRAGREGRRIVCISSAAFILAEAGLLDGRHAVTHWGAAPLLADRHPRVEVDGAALFTREGNIWTSAGSAAGIDLALAIVEEDYGREAAAKIAASLLLPFRRAASVSQQSVMLAAGQPTDRFDEVMGWARAHLAEDLSIQRLADRAALSVRQFTRAFRLSTGLSAAKFVEQLRIERGRALIEGGARSLDEVARSCGFHNAERMRRATIPLSIF